jgi:hypothetical protein
MAFRLLTFCESGSPVQYLRLGILPESCKPRPGATSKRSADRVTPSVALPKYLPPSVIHYTSTSRPRFVRLYKKRRKPSIACRDENLGDGSVETGSRTCDHMQIMGPTETAYRRVPFPPGSVVEILGPSQHCISSMGGFSMPRL